MTAPGPLESNRGAIGLKVLLHTNSEGVSSGFKARYFFDVAKPIFGGEFCVLRPVLFTTANVEAPNDVNVFLRFVVLLFQQTAVAISATQIPEKCRVRIFRSNILHRKRECQAERAIGL